MRVATLQRDKVRDVWLNQESLATTLLVLFLDLYGDEGTECLQWDSETIRAELEDDLKITLPRLSLDKLMAAILVVTTDRFYKNLPDFITICNILSGDSFDPRIWDPADAVECAWGITEALLLDPPEDDNDSPFSDEIEAYVAKVVETEGIINPPDVLRLGGSGEPGLAGTWSDDPAMFSAIWKKDNEKSEDIRHLVRERLGRLIHQLEALPLARGDTSKVVEKMLKVMPSAAGAA